MTLEFEMRRPDVAAGRMMPGCWLATELLMPELDELEAVNAQERIATDRTAKRTMMSWQARPDLSVIG